MNYKYPKNRRLKKRDEISRVFETGIRVWDSQMTVVGLRRDEADQPWRLSPAVSKKHGNAVMRNRVKRLVREAARLSQHQIPDGWDFMIIPRPTENYELQKLQNSLVKLVNKICKNHPPIAGI